MLRRKGKPLCWALSQFSFCMVWCGQLLTVFNNLSFPGTPYYCQNPSLQERHGLSEIGELCCFRGASSCQHGFSCSESHGFVGSCLDISLFCCLQKNMGPEGRNTFLRCKSSLFATKFSPTPTQIHSLCRKTQIHANAEPFVTEPNSHSARAGSVMVQSRRC